MMTESLETEFNADMNCDAMDLDQNIDWLTEFFKKCFSCFFAEFCITPTLFSL